MDALKSMSWAVRHRLAAGVTLAAMLAGMRVFRQLVREGTLVVASLVALLASPFAYAEQKLERDPDFEERVQRAQGILEAKAANRQWDVGSATVGGAGVVLFVGGVVLGIATGPLGLIASIAIAVGTTGLVDNRLYSHRYTNAAERRFREEFGDPDANRALVEAVRRLAAAAKIAAESSGHNGARSAVTVPASAGALAGPSGPGAGTDR